MKINHPFPPNRGRRVSGFTLVELLVVIAIIVTLLSMLMPALGKAQQAAEGAACSAHLRQVGQGLSNYGFDSFGQFAGPNTSGAKLTVSNNPADYAGGPRDPWQNADWISPTLGDSLGFSQGQSRSDRIAAVFNNKLACPSVSQKWMSQYAGPAVPNPTSIAVNSYLTPWWFHWAHPSSVPFSGAIYQFTSEIEVPIGYAPRLSTIGSPSGKVYAMDGTQYIQRDMASGVLTDVDFQTWAKVISGNSFSTDGPCLTNHNGNPYYRVNGKLSEAAKFYAYRHNERLNAVFFDGHTQSMGDAESRPVRLYVPRGTRIVNASSTDDPTDSNGMTVE